MRTSSLSSFSPAPPFWPLHPNDERAPAKSTARAARPDRSGNRRAGALDEEGPVVRGHRDVVVRGGPKSLEKLGVSNQVQVPGAADPRGYYPCRRVMDRQ